VRPIGTHGWAAYHEARRRELIDEPESVTATVTDPDEGLAFEWSSGRGKAATGLGGAAWHDNSSKVVNADFGSLTENDREHIRETMSKISARFSEKSRLPLTQKDGCGSARISHTSYGRNGGLWRIRRTSATPMWTMR
jgi:hypothetical protein